MKLSQCILALIGATSMGLAGCSDDGKPPEAMAPEAHHQHMSMPAGEPVSGQSLHQLQSQWTDQNGEPTKISDFAGQIVVLALVYTHCDNACPRIIADMRRIRTALGEQHGQVTYALASIDPERDSVARLRTFGEETGLTEQGWRLLRADVHIVRELAAVLGVQYTHTSATDFAHSNLISVLGPDGVIQHQQNGLGVAPDATIAKVRELLSAGLQPTHPKGHAGHS